MLCSWPSSVVVLEVASPTRCRCYRLQNVDDFKLHCVVAARGRFVPWLLARGLRLVDCSWREVVDFLCENLEGFYMFTEDWTVADVMDYDALNERQRRCLLNVVSGSQSFSFME